MRETAFITGAASGIGRATASLLVSRGWTVGLADRNAAGLATLAAELGPEAAEAWPCDVADPAALRTALRAFCAPRGGRLDLLVNNAGVLHIGPFETLDPAAHAEMIEVNARGVVEGLLAAFPMLRAARGRVVNIASASANYGTPDFATYAATKAFVRSLSEALDIEWRRHDVRVACIMPAFVATPMIAGRQSPSMQRLGVELHADDVAGVVWRAIGSRRLMWHVGARYRILRALSEPLPGELKRVMMRWVTGY